MDRLRSHGGRPSDKAWRPSDDFHGCERRRGRRRLEHSSMILPKPKATSARRGGGRRWGFTSLAASCTPSNRARREPSKTHVTGAPNSALVLLCCTVLYHCTTTVRALNQTTTSEYAPRELVSAGHLLGTGALVASYREGTESSLRGMKVGFPKRQGLATAAGGQHPNSSGHGRWRLVFTEEVGRSSCRSSDNGQHRSIRWHGARRQDVGGCGRNQCRYARRRRSTGRGSST